MGGGASQVQPLSNAETPKSDLSIPELAKSTTGCVSAASRSKLWQTLLAVDEAEQQTSFERLETEAHSADTDQIKVIDNDVPRTDRTIPLWQDPSALQPLRRILVAHLVQSPVIGYYQGMNDIAAVIWSTIPELPAAYFCFSAWVQMHQLNWSPDFEGIWQQANVILAVLRVVDAPLADKLLKCSLPKQPLPFLFQTIFLRLKREMRDYEETRRLWEVCWAARLDKADGLHFDLLCIVALVLSQRRKLLRIPASGLEGLGRAQKVFNNLYGTQMAKPLLSRAHSLHRLPAVRAALTLNGQADS